MADRREELEASIDRLYALPLSEFTAARNDLARRLRGEGEGDDATAVRGLRKPSVVAWALNQTQRRHPERGRALLAVGERLRDAQEKLLAGGGREALQRAVADERDLIDQLAEAAEHELRAAGQSIGPSHQERLRSTLHAVASDPEAREGLAAGRLIRDHEASGLGPLIGPGAPPARSASRQPAKATRGAEAARRRNASRVVRRLERARARRRELEEQTADAGRRVRQARADADRAATALERAQAAELRARDRAQRAAAELGQLERELRELTGGAS